MSTFGDIERTFADLYEYRWAIGAGVLVFLAAVIAFGYWKGWHLVIWRHRLLVGAISTPMLVVTVWLGWSLGSPLFTNVTVEEEFPLAFTAVIPSDMDMDEVEGIMSGIAKVQQSFTEDMPDSSVTVAPFPVLVMDESGQAMLKKGLDIAKDAMKSSDDAAMDEGLEMMASAIATMESQSQESGSTTGTGAEAQSEAGSTQQLEPVALKVGNFMDADSFHKGSGSATIYRGSDGSYLLRLEDLDVTNGPDLRVVLSPHENPDNPGEVKTPGYVELGKLKGNRGNQNYPIPDDVDIAAHQSVIIYCKPFSVIFSVATLEDLVAS